MKNQGREQGSSPLPGPLGASKRKLGLRLFGRGILERYGGRFGNFREGISFRLRNVFGGWTVRHDRLQVGSEEGEGPFRTYGLPSRAPWPIKQKVSRFGLGKHASPRG
jgi:hypothetical protein